MNFAVPSYLLALIPLLPLLLFFHGWAGAQKRRALERFAGTELLQQLSQSVSPARQRLKTALILLAFALLGISLARPRWGSTQEVIQRKGVEILLAVDVSKSMLAQDLQPSRIERARREIQDLLKLLDGHKVGLIAFAGEAFVHCPPTTDLDACALFIESIDIGLIQRGGTHIGDAIRQANRVFAESAAAQKALILITDGEDQDTNPTQAAEEARKLGVKIYAIGMGTPEGSFIPLPDAKGNQVYLRDRQGQYVKVRLDETTLQKVALETGGAYHRATGAGLELEEIFNKIELLEKSELESQKLQRYQERYQIFLLLGFALLVAEASITDRRKKPAPSSTAPEIPQPAGEKAPVPLMLLLTLLGSAPGLAGESVADRVREGNHRFENKDLEGAMSLYQDARTDSPESPELNYNIGNVYYEQKKLEQALQSFQEAIQKGQPALKADAQFNLGNCYYRRAQQKESAEKLEEALEDAKTALDLYKHARQTRRAMRGEEETEDPDLSHNIEFVQREVRRIRDKILKRLEEQEKQNKDQEKEESKKQEQGDQQQQQEGGESEKQQAQKNQEEKKEPAGSEDKETGEKQQDKEKQEAQGQAQRMSPEQARAMLEQLSEKEKEQMKNRQIRLQGGRSTTDKDW